MPLEAAIVQHPEAEALLKVLVLGLRIPKDALWLNWEKEEGKGLL